MKLLSPLLFLLFALRVEGLATGEGDCQAYTVLGKPDEYATSTTGVKLAVRRWVPNNVKAVILFHHGGAGWHTGYSDIMGRSMQEAGIAVVSYDTVGSGYSEGMKGGKRNYFDSIDTLMADYEMMLGNVRAEYPKKKIFGMSESFGGIVLLAHILKEQEKGDSNGVLADGYVFAGPLVKVLPEMLPPKPVIVVLNFLARFFPMLSTPGTDQFSTFDLAFGDKQWAQAGRNDPIIQEAAEIPPRIGMASSILNTIIKVNESLEKINVPFKIFMGENEGRVDVGAVKRLAEVAMSSDKDIEIIKDGYHQLFQDTPEVTQVVCKHIQQWVLARA